MKVRALLQSSGLLICLAALTSAHAQEKKAPTARVKERLGDPMLRILANAARVECFRIDPHRTAPDDAKPTGTQIDGYRIIATAPDQGRSFAAKLAAALQDEKSLFSAQAKCFYPGVAFRIWSGKECGDVVLCYLCTGVRLVARDADGNVLRRASGGFSQNWALFVRLAREAFPDDAEIQRLHARANVRTGIREAWLVSETTATRRLEACLYRLRRRGAPNWTRE